MSKNKRKRSPRNVERYKVSTIDLVIGAVIFGLFTILVNIYVALFWLLGVVLIFFLNYKFKPKLMSEKKANKKSILKLITIVFLSLIILFIIGFLSLSALVVATSPKFNEELLVKKESSLIYDKDDNLITEIGVQKRENKDYEEMSETLIDAVIATEDSRFFEHNGLDGMRFLKASLGTLLNRQNSGGASTISMQIIKNTYTDTGEKKKIGFKKYLRKFNDIYLAVFKLEKKYTKKEILETYLNSHFLGANSNGVEQAAKTYFNKSASQLNLAEASLIAGLFQAPGAYNPFVNPELALQRRNTVLNLMVRHGYISEAERDIVKEISLERILANQKAPDRYQAYIDTVLEELNIKGYNPYVDSIIIYTNMDRAKQDGMDNIFSGKTYKWKNDKLQAGFAAIDTHTGKIEAVGSGRNNSVKRGFNFATKINRQIGSTAKPIFDYGPGMEFNNWSTHKIWLDQPYQYSSGQPVRNSDGRYFKDISTRVALAESRNIPALKAFQSVKNSNILKFVQGLGIEPEIENGKIHEAHALGAYNSKTSNPRDIAAAYAAFGNGGTYYKPYTVRKIVNRVNNDKKEFQPDGKKAMSDSTAFMITDILNYGSQHGLAHYVIPINLQKFVAAKTGTTNFNEDFRQKNNIPSNGIGDFWVAGYDNNTVLAMWMGYEKATSKTYLDLNRDFHRRNQLYQTAAKFIFQAKTPFKAPKSVVKIPVVPKSDPAIRTSSGGNYEYFKKGTEPSLDNKALEKLPNVKNLTYKYDKDNKTLTLTWSKVKQPKETKDSYGKFGYKVLKDGVHVKNTFVEENQYVFNNVADPTGTYTVITSYEAFSANASGGATITIEDKATYEVTLKVPFSEYTLNQEWEPYDINPSSDDLEAKKNNVIIDVTVRTILYDINDNDKETTYAKAHQKAGDYRLVYAVYYDVHLIKQVSRIITVKP